MSRGLGDVYKRQVVAEDGTRTDLIKNGRFVLDGTLALNDAFLQEQ